MAVMNQQLRELNGRIMSGLASNQFGNAGTSRGDIRALGTLVTQFINRVDMLEQGKATPDPQPEPIPATVQPVGTNLDKEEDEPAED